MSKATSCLIAAGVSMFLTGLLYEPPVWQTMAIAGMIELVALLLWLRGARLRKIQRGRRDALLNEIGGE